MGNNVSAKSFFDLKECDDLNKFLSFVNMIDEFHSDTCLSISSKCLYMINNLLNTMKDNPIKLIEGLEFQPNEDLLNKIERLKFQCSLIRHLGIANSATECVEEWAELNNVGNLLSLTLDHIPIRYVLHLKRHRQMLLRLSLHYSIENLESVINLCGGDHSFPVDWINLLHLDIRYNNLKTIDNSVEYLTALKVLDISRNNIEDLSFVGKILTLECLNASFNNIRSLPHVIHTRLRTLILAYNFIDSLEGIQSFKFLSTLNVSYNMIANNDYLLRLKEMDCLKDLVLQGNPIFCSRKYRQLILDNVSLHVSINFALDGISLTKKENIYLRKRDVIFIQPPLPPSSVIPGNVPVIVVTRNESLCDLDGEDSDCNGKRHIRYTTIDEGAMSSTGDNVHLLRRRFSRHKEKQIESLSGSEKTDFGTLSVYKRSRMESLLSHLDSYIHIPNYIGKKSSNLLIARPNKDCCSFIHVSVQIFEHKLMAVDEFDVTRDNADLWLLMAATTDTMNEGLDAGNVLKLVFFGSSVQCSDLLLTTRTIEFYEVEEQKKFLHELSLYLQNFSISYHDWPNLPLINIHLKCSKCSLKVASWDNNPRPYVCQKCSGTSFIFQDTLSMSQEDLEIQGINERRKQKLNTHRRRARTTLIPNWKNTNSKSSTSKLVIRAFGSSESLTKKNPVSTLVSCEVVTDQYRSFHQSLEELNESFQYTGIEFRVPETVSNECDADDVLNLDEQVKSIVLDVEQSIIPHEMLEDNAAFALLKAAVSTPWVVDERAYNMKMYMHDSRRIDDRYKLYLLSSVMQSHEELLFVFRVYFVYRSAGMATAALVVISNSRVIIFSLVDIESTNFTECLKFNYEFPLKSLQQLEYCLNNQWLELQFKAKPTVTLMLGDSDSVKVIGISIAEAVSQISSNFLVFFSKEIKELKYSHLVSVMTDESYKGVSLETLSLGESYLIRSSTVIPTMERSSLEYAPKMIVIERNHIFFVTFTYSTNNPLPSMDLTRTILLYTVMQEMKVDTSDDCIIRLIVMENDLKNFVDIKFLSPHSRSKAGQYIAKIWKDLFNMEMAFIAEDLSAI